MSRKKPSLKSVKTQKASRGYDKAMTADGLRNVAANIGARKDKAFYNTY